WHGVALLAHAAPERARQRSPPRLRARLRGAARAARPRLLVLAGVRGQPRARLRSARRLLGAGDDARGTAPMSAVLSPSERKLRVSALRDFLRLYRVADWIHFLPLPLAGWLAGEARDALALVAGVAAWALALAYTSAINQAFDARVDRADPAKNPVGKRFGRREAVILSLPPALAS